MIKAYCDHLIEEEVKKLKLDQLLVFKYEGKKCSLVVEEIVKESGTKRLAVIRARANKMLFRKPIILNGGASETDVNGWTNERGVNGGITENGGEAIEGGVNSRKASEADVHGESFMSDANMELHGGVEANSRENIEDSNGTVNSGTIEDGEAVESGVNVEGGVNSGGASEADVHGKSFMSDFEGNYTSEDSGNCDERKFEGYSNFCRDDYIDYASNQGAVQEAASNQGATQEVASNQGTTQEAGSNQSAGAEFEGAGTEFQHEDTVGSSGKKGRKTATGDRGAEKAVSCGGGARETINEETNAGTTGAASIIGAGEPVLGSNTNADGNDADGEENNGNVLVGDAILSSSN
ncbi:hypothetical protein ACH5RR_014232 [Cinchona calisaya]|uniref:Uncharacterized protein n=1 Tax=Cinchona calisaya TaxID=153742 RepID=A0ABD3A296_9GENT